MLQLQSVKTSKIASFKNNNHYEVIIVMPTIDMALAARAADVMMRRTDQPGLLILAEDDARLGFIMTANLVYAKTRSDFFSYVAQDAFPGQYWLDYGLETLKQSKNGLLAFNDGRFFGKIAVFGLVNREWCRSLYKNFIFYPQYTSHFADTELSILAYETSNLVFNPYSIMMEVDYEKHLHPNNKDDEKLYIERAKNGFDGRIQPFSLEMSQ